MVSLTTIPCLTLLLICSASSSADQKNITAKSGEDTTLPCRTADDKHVIAVEWRRTDLGSEYVLLYRDERFDQGNQLPSYKNRVDLLINRIKVGDASLVLKNTTTDDSGTYECRVQTEGSHKTKLLSTINLQVAPPPPDQRNITVKPGEDTILPCYTPDSKLIINVEWTRTDLGSEYVLLYKDKQIDPTFQHPAYKGRVDLLDRQMKDGNVSLVLKDVATNDTGTYECQVQNEGSRKTKLVGIIQLQVSAPGDGGNKDADTDGSVGLIVALILFVLVVVGAAGVLFLIYKKQLGCLRKKTPDPPVEL
ncbi:coxsackievirus and adenovirus receptor homolog [Anableps anableps]